MRVSRILFANEDARVRIRPYALIIFFIWPVFSMMMAVIEFKLVPYFSIPWSVAFLASAAGTLLLLPDFLVVGSLCAAFGIVLFSVLSARRLLAPRGHFHEPMIMFLSIVFGTSIVFPGLMGLPSMAAVHGLPVWTSFMFLAAIIFGGVYFVAQKSKRAVVFSAVLMCGMIPVLIFISRGYLVAVTIRQQPPLVLLGLDSISQTDDLRSLNVWASWHGATWYSKPVPPGLLTNSVWASIMTMRPVNDHGVFHVFQSLGPDTAGVTLLSQAKNQGYWTVSVFPDQLTCSIGSTFGFDEDRSGSVGWRQLATSFVSNGSLLLPLFRPVLPRIAFASAPRNQAGTFTYDLDRELDEIFTAYSPIKPVFVAAHTTYLHSPVYPRLTEISWAEWSNLFAAAAGQLRDRSLDWQDTDSPTDPIPLHRWKLQRLQNAVIQSIGRTEFLKRGGRLVLFSDHGDRAGMTLSNFTDERYHRVLLVTFGGRPRAHDVPLSLLEIADLLGLAGDSQPHSPKLEFTLAKPDEWPLIAKTAKPRFDGSIELDETILNSVFRSLRTYEPWTTSTP